MDLGSETLFQRSKCSKYSLSQLDVFEIAKGQRYSICKSRKMHICDISSRILIIVTNMYMFVSQLIFRSVIFRRFQTTCNRLRLDSLGNLAVKN